MAPTADSTRYVIVGGGVAGARAAEALRGADGTAALTLIGAEPERPYERPELSKGYLAGQTKRDDLAVLDDDWYAAHDVDLVLGSSAVRIDRTDREVVLDDGSTVPYDRLLLATGSEPLPLRVPGADLDGVLGLRRVEDSEAISAALSRAEADGGPLVVVGGGWIGLEVAAVARQRGLPVTVLEAAPHVLQRALGGDVGVRLAAAQRRHGVDVRTGVTVRRLLGDPAAGSRRSASGRSAGRSAGPSGTPGDAVRGVELEGGEVLPAAVVLAGVGIRPRTELAEAAGLEVDDGIVVDAALRTSDPAIWAAGDVANAWNDWVGGRLRVEHFSNADNQGPFAGRSMAAGDGFTERWDRPPFFWSDQFEVALEYRGWADPATSRTVIRETDPDRPWFAFWLDDESRVSAALHVNGWDDTDALDRLVRERVRVDPAALADPGTPLPRG